jgi:hypothetical protein
MMQDREYLYWSHKYEAVNYVRRTKKLQVESQSNKLPRVVMIDDKIYYVRVSKYLIVKVPKISN